MFVFVIDKEDHSWEVNNEKCVLVCDDKECILDTDNKLVAVCDDGDVVIKMAAQGQGVEQNKKDG